MPVDVVCGGQGGDEGKGKVIAYLARKGDYQIGVRVGGPNAGHTVLYEGKVYPLRCIPSAFVNPRTKLLLGPGSYLRVDWLLEEVENCGVRKRLGIDPRATIISDRHVREERSSKHAMRTIGSVGTGLGKTLRDKVERKLDLRFVRHEPELKEFLLDVPMEIAKACERGENVILEGTQGFKLSLTHGEYPFVTSRDVTAGNFLSEAGVGPTSVRDIYLVFKPYVTRVGPGPLEEEIEREELLKKYHERGREIATVSRRKRRVGKFEWENAVRAIAINGATKLVLTHLDMFDGNYGIRNFGELTYEAKSFIKIFKTLETFYPHPKLVLISTGPRIEDMIDLRD
jgi:adenylosuccinate synthase